ncbi:MAG: hypothetical protein ACOCX4_05255 [Planctomycetota bacterium]
MADAMRIDADIPGGNGLAEIDADGTVVLRPDLRDTEGFWFYWHVRVRGAAGQTVRVRLAASPTVAARGPAFSTDGGVTWRWLGAEAMADHAFAIPVDAGVDELRLSMGMPYTDRDLCRFLAEPASAPVERRTLCRTRKGRDAPLLHLLPTGTPRVRMLLTARHHACEMMVNYTIEGLLDAALAPAHPARNWLRSEVDLWVVPFADVDGVEDGDQGKKRRPHDHNRDYGDAPIYPETEAIMALARGWDATPLIFLDLHCPYIVGANSNETVFVVGNPDPEMWAAQQRFSRCLAETAHTLVHDPDDNVPYGVGWNSRTHYAEQQSAAQWFGEQRGILLASTLEIPYATARGAEVNQATARALGRDLAAALHRFALTPGS